MKRLSPPRQRPGKRYFLNFEGIGTYATVTVNGHTFDRRGVGRTTLTLDITPYLKTENRLKITVEHPEMITDMPWVCGGCSSEWGFSEGSQPFGIFRPVTLVETDEVRIEPLRRPRVEQRSLRQYLHRDRNTQLWHHGCTRPTCQ